MSIKEELMMYWKVSELRKFASELKIKGRSKMDGEQLVEAITKVLQAS